MPCTIVSVEPTPLGTAAVSGGHVLGPADAPVTLQIFSDFTCTACAALASDLDQIYQEHPGQIRIIFYHMPATQDALTLEAMRASEAADLQGKFWLMHDLLFSQQSVWLGKTPADFVTWVTGQAAGLGLNQATFTTDLSGQVVSTRIQQALTFAAGISYSPPMLFINGTQYTGLADTSSLDQVVSLLLLDTRKFTSCPSWQVDPTRQYLASLLTNRGTIVLELYPDKAPLAVNAFIFLARSGWYNNIPWFLVDPGLAAKTGDPSGTGLGNPGFYFETELAPDLSFNKPGVVAMVNSGADTNGSSFFITYAPVPNLDGMYTIFGQVLTGMDVLQSLQTNDTLISVTVQEK
jgi:cyclophilin family peptidyl-prolyl cis-trans isomerase/protein-disulfide isomerase